MKKLITVLISSLLIFGCQYETEGAKINIETHLPADAINVKWVTNDAARYSSGYGWLSFERKGICYIYLKAGRASVLSQSKCVN